MGEGLEEGIRLFDEGRYFECHEVWESAWRNAPPADRAFLKGLTQLAVCLLHAERGNARGALTLRYRAERHLNAYRPAHATIDLDALLVLIPKHSFPKGCGSPDGHPQIPRFLPLDSREAEARGAVS